MGMGGMGGIKKKSRYPEIILSIRKGQAATQILPICEGRGQPGGAKDFLKQLSLLAFVQN
jgi:hypothetical protein